MYMTCCCIEWCICNWQCSCTLYLTKWMRATVTCDRETNNFGWHCLLSGAQKVLDKKVHKIAFKGFGEVEMMVKRQDDNSSKTAKIKPSDAPRLQMNKPAPVKTTIPPPRKKVCSSWVLIALCAYTLWTFHLEMMSTMHLKLFNKSQTNHMLKNEEVILFWMLLIKLEEYPDY